MLGSVQADAQPSSQNPVWVCLECICLCAVVCVCMCLSRDPLGCY